MYKNLVILDKKEHATLKVQPLNNLLFAKNVPHIPVTLKEVETVSQTFPIVFSLEEEPSLTAIVSLGSENLAITENGKWIDSYIPTFIGKYPFTLANTTQNETQKVVMIDETASVLNKSKGKQLFKQNGDKSEILEKAIAVLTEFEQDLYVTKRLSKEIADSGILERRDITVENDGKIEILVQGFQVVSRKKLNNLDKDLLEDWNKRGILKLIDLHLNSLGNVALLFKIAKQRQS